MKKLFTIVLCVLLSVSIAAVCLTAHAAEGNQTDNPKIVIVDEYHSLKNVEGYCIVFSAKNYVTNTIYLYHNDELCFSTETTTNSSPYSTTGEAGEYYYIISSKNSKSETISEKKYFTLEKNEQIDFLDTSREFDKETVNISNFDWNVDFNYSQIEYTGKPITPQITSLNTYLGELCISEEGNGIIKVEKIEADKSNYSVSYKNNKEVGTASIIITGIGKYTGTITKTFKITKATNTVKVTAKTTVKAKAKKKTTIKKVITVKNPKGKVTYSTNNKKVTVKNGTMTVAKGLKKSKTYKIKVTITVKGNGNYKSKKIVKYVKVKVK